MQSRMDRYSTENKPYNSRTQKNSALYDNVKNSMITDFDVNSNVSIISDNADDIISVKNVKRYLDNRYSANSPKRKSIEVPNFEFKNEDELTEDTKEYDINAIIEKAKQGKNIDYTKERLKKVRDTQYEILNNLDLEIKKTSEPLSSQRQQEEENLKNLINTITQLELCNRNSEKEYSKKEISQNLDLLSDLSSNSKENQNDDKMEKNDNDDSLEPTVTVTKIDTEKYQKEFADISYNDKSTIIIKIIIFIVILVLIFGAVYIVNNILDLGLFG